MSEKAYILNVYNTMTGEFELVQVTKEVFQTYRRTKWHIEDSTERFYKHETQMSSLIGGENDGYERFHEFIDYDNTPENQAIEEMVRQSLRNILDLLPPKDYELIYELYFKNRSEKEYAQMLGVSQQAIHVRKKRILKKIKNNGFIENLVVFYLENSGHKITLYTKRWFALANHFFLCYNIFRYFSIFGGFLLTLNQYLL